MDLNNVMRFEASEWKERDIKLSTVCSRHRRRCEREIPSNVWALSPSPVVVNYSTCNPYHVIISSLKRITFVGGCSEQATTWGKDYIGT